jgi:hypothetical protein
MNSGARYRGQPLLVLLILLGGWVGLRMALWQTPFARAIVPAQILAVLPLPAAPTVAPPPVADEPAWRLAPRPQPGWLAQQPMPPAPVWQAAPSQPAAPVGEPPAPLAPKVAAGHQLMLLAAFSQVPIPGDLAMLFDPARHMPTAGPVQSPAQFASASLADRWSADAWLLLRQDTTTAVTSGRGSYGQSQAGAVIRYRLAPSSGLRPTAYLRASQALAGARESEAALGLAARPVPKLPVTAAAELRVTESGGGVHVRPAAYAVTELPPFDLPLGFTGEAYAQAGYVWGDFRTGFVDGQVSAERPVARLGGAELRAGGGAWGGAQKGAKRLDVGPSATLALRIGEAPSRVSVDWRFRVAGDANPSSGPALTLSAGF